MFAWARRFGLVSSQTLFCLGILAWYLGSQETSQEKGRAQRAHALAMMFLLPGQDRQAGYHVLVAPLSTRTASQCWTNLFFVGTKCVCLCVCVREAIDLRPDYLTNNVGFAILQFILPV